MAKKAKSPYKAKSKPAASGGLPARSSGWRKNLLVRFVVLWLAGLSVSMSFFFSNILKNFSYLEVFPYELVLPTVMHTFTALLITLAVFWISWLRGFTGKLVAVVVLALFMVGYDANLQAVSGVVRAFMPGLTDSDPMPLVSLVYLVMLFTIAVLVGKGIEILVSRAKRVQSRDVQLGMFVLLAYLLIFPALSVVMMMPTIIKQTRVQAAELAKPANPASTAEKPDIYYIVLDRYANSEVLKSQFDYDNSPFMDFLKSNDFTINGDAYANYPYTPMSISSTMNAQYTNELVEPFKNSKVQSRTLYHNLVWQSSVAKALKKEGYRYYPIGSGYGTTYKAPLADRDYPLQSQLTVFGVSKRLRGMELLEFGKSPYLQFAQLTKINWWPVKFATSDHVSDVRRQLGILEDLSTKEQPGGRFIFAHLLVPHDPYVFNADGSLSPYSSSDGRGEPIKKKYVRQIEFVNSQMEELINNIQNQSDGQAVVILNSDEGPYPQLLNDTFKQPQAADREHIEAIIAGEDMRKWPDDYFKMKFGILQAVHMPKAAPEDMANLSSVNVFRILLNSYFGYDLEYLPQCHFGLTRGSQNEFNYVDITDRFSANPDKTCAQKQVQPTSPSKL